MVCMSSADRSRIHTRVYGRRSMNGVTPPRTRLRDRALAIHRRLMRIDYLVHHPTFMRELAEWHQSEWGELEPEESLATRLADFQRYGGAGALPTALIAQDGALLGSALLLAEDLAIRPSLSPWLAGVYVRRERRGEGIASALVAAAIEEARRQGLAQLWLYTPHNASLYARLGFQPHEQLTFRGTDVTLMQLTF
jgi:GNAT superfamily N-acetyltransferase